MSTERMTSRFYTERYASRESRARSPVWPRSRTIQKFIHGFCGIIIGWQLWYCRPNNSSNPSMIDLKIGLSSIYHLIKNTLPQFKRIKWRCVCGPSLFSKYTANHKHTSTLQIISANKITKHVSSHDKCDILMIDCNVTDNNKNRTTPLKKHLKGLMVFPHLECEHKRRFYPLKSQEISLSVFQLGTNNDIGKDFASKAQTQHFLSNRNSITS